MDRTVDNSWCWCGAISWAAADHWFVHFRSSLICAAEDSVPVSHRGPGPLVVSCGRSPVPLFMMQILCRKCVCAVPSPQYSTDSADVSGIIRIDAINNLYRPSKCCFNYPSISMFRDSISSCPLLCGPRSCWLSPVYTVKKISQADFCWAFMDKTDLMKWQ